jgi:Flagellar protein YcgR/PilZ domain
MRSNQPLQEQAQIIVGKPIPFSVYNADGILLLAAGQMVDSDQTRYVLLRSGHRLEAIGGKAAPFDRAKDPAELRSVTRLGAFESQLRQATSGRRFVITMAQGESAEAVSTWMVGMHDKIMVVATPLRPDGSMVAVVPGQVWLCRTFQVTSAFRFHSTVLKVASEPFPHLYLSAPKGVATRKVRDRTRVTVLVPATLECPALLSCLLVDLSAGGGRIATASDSFVLERQQSIRVAFKLELTGRAFELSLKAVVVGVFGATEREHPDIQFYGIKFLALTEVESLVLQAFVSTHQALELNCLWQVLSIASPGTDP